MFWLTRTNQVLAAIAGLLTVTAVMLFLWPAGELRDPEVDPTRSALPSSAPELSQETYEAIGTTILKLKTEPPNLQLPDLRRHLLYYGANRRQTRCLRAAVGSPLPPRYGWPTGCSQHPTKQPVYLSYEAGEGNRGTYTFSVDNTETGLWIEVLPNQGEKSADVLVRMRDQNDSVVTEPDDHHRLTLRERPLPRYGSNRWELEGQRVDAGILARQKARWYGLDRFMIDHGGVAVEQATQRIQFGADDGLYVVDLKPGDYLVWRESRWQRADSLGDTIGLPLLLLTEVTDRQLQFDLWDGEGKFNVKVRLNRARERWDTRRIQRDFRFAGARTRSRMNLDIGDQRVVVQPQDWILLTEDEAWVPIDTEERLDRFLRSELNGQLMIIDGIERVEGQQALVAHLYSPSRSDRKELRFLTAEPFVIIDGSIPPQLQQAASERAEANQSPSNPEPEDVESLDEEDEELPFEIPEGISPEEIRERWQQFRQRGSNFNSGQAPAPDANEVSHRISELGRTIRLKPAQLEKSSDEV